MITGTVNVDLEATIQLQVRGPGGQEQEIEAIIDTGFNGFLILPPALVTSLNLPPLGRGRATLANGNEEVFHIYESTVIWDGQPRTVETNAIGVEPLVGMSLLHEHDLWIHAAEGGQVTIQAPPG